MNEYVGITGAGGVLGSILQEKLKQTKVPFSCFEGDVCSKEDITSWLRNQNFTKIVHLAAVVSTKDVEKDLEKATRVNVGGTRNLVDALLKLDSPPWLFYASTSHVYKSKNSPIKEEDAKEPISEYGKTKYLAEKEVTQNYKNYCIGRIFSFYHETQKKPFLYPTIKERLANEDLTKPFELYGSESERDFLEAGKVVNIIISLMREEIVGVYNIASGKPTKIKDFVQEMTNYPLKIVDKGNRDYLVAEISKLNKVLNR
jgi:nucleoside-diphosphate-sugar epimerase